MSGGFGGYEWGFTCPSCETVNDIRGLANVLQEAKVDGEGRVDKIEPGDEITCAECEESFTFELNKVSDKGST